MIPGILAAGAVRADGPTPGGDPYWPYVAALLHFDGVDGATTFDDETGREWVRSGDAKLTTAAYRFGGASLSLDGSGDYLTSVQILQGAEDWTVECWVRVPSHTRIRRLWSQRTASNVDGRVSCYLQASGQVSLFIGGTSGFEMTGATALPVNAWVHLAFVREGSEFRVYVNGSLDATPRSSPQAVQPTTFYIGRDPGNTPQDFIGGIDEFRVTRGVIRYADNFDPPQHQFPSQGIGEPPPHVGIFSLVQSVDLFEVSPPALREVEDGFATNNFTVTTASGADAAWSVTDGYGQMAMPSSPSFMIARHSDGELTMPQGWVEVEVLESGTGTIEYDVIGVGWTVDTLNRVILEYDRRLSGGTLRFSIRHAGGATQTYPIAGSQGLAFPYKLGLGMSGGVLSAWKFTGGAWTLVGTRDITANRDMKLAANLAGMKPTLAFSSSGTTTWKVDNFIAGRFGSTGLKDPKLVYRRDGTPLMIGDDLVLTTTALHPGAGSGYQAVYKIDPATFAFEQIGAIYFDRGGKLENDLNLTAVELEDGTWHAFAATWGGPSGAPLDVVDGEFATYADFLEGSKVITMTATAMPAVTGAAGKYDASVVWDGARYLMGFAATDSLNFSPESFRPCMAESTDLATWTLVGADYAKSAVEGPSMAIVGGIAYMITAQRGAPIVYDSSMTELGTMGLVPAFNSDTIPHIALFRRGENRVALTFGTGYSANGDTARRDLIVYEST